MNVMSHRDSYYFAYGSNMKSEHLRNRIGDFATCIIGRVPDIRFLFNKKSSDGTAKANIVQDPDYEVWGVVYGVTPEQLKRLDQIEIGYERRAVNVRLSDGSTIRAETYCSARPVDDLLPYEWYKRLVVDGAIENSLPTEYVRYLRSFRAEPDDPKTTLDAAIKATHSHPR